MFRSVQIGTFLCFASLLVFVALPGCEKKTPAPAKDSTAKGGDKGKDDKKDHDHGETGPHGGPLAEWDDIYHAEFTLDPANKTAVVYILDDKAKAAPKIEPDKITKVKVSIIGTKPLVQVDLKHDAKLSSEKGIAFTGTHDNFGKNEDMKLDISGNVNDKPHTGNATYKAVTPKKTANLTTTPGGIYTAADIKANGGVTPKEKYEGRQFDHDQEVAVGDRICPISKGKADSGCVWVVQGQTYQFCCFPCINGFVKKAHESPAEIKDAKEYVFTAK